jgi:hypothetical protein
MMIDDTHGSRNDQYARTFADAVVSVARVELSSAKIAAAPAHAALRDL